MALLGKVNLIINGEERGETSATIPITSSIRGSKGGLMSKGKTSTGVKKIRNLGKSKEGKEKANIATETNTAMIKIKGDPFQFGLEGDAMLRVLVNVSDPNETKPAYTPTNDNDDAVASMEGLSIQDPLEEDDSSLEQNDYHHYILEENELRILRQQLMRSEQTNGILQMELANAQHDAMQDERMVSLLHDENNALRDELNESAQNCIRAEEECNTAKTAGEMLPIYENRVNELLEELKKRDLEVLCLKEELGEIRGHYKDRLVDSLLWDDDGDGGDGNNDGNDNGGEDKAEGGAGEHKLAAAAASSLQFGRLLAAAGRKVIEEKVATRQEEAIAKEADKHDGDAPMTPIEEEEEADEAEGNEGTSSVALEEAEDDGILKKQEGEVTPDLPPTQAGDTTNDNDDDNSSSPPSKEEGDNGSTGDEMAETPSEAEPAANNDDGSNVPRKGWGVRRLGASLKGMEEKMRVRQQLFREQQQKLLAEQEAEEAERLKNAAPGLGEVLVSRIPQLNKSTHGSRQTTKEAYAALESLDKSHNGSVNEGVDEENEEPTPTTTAANSEDTLNDNEATATDDEDPSIPSDELERNERNQALILQSMLEDELLSGVSTPFSNEEVEEAVKTLEFAAILSIPNKEEEDKVVPGDLSSDGSEGFRDFLRIVSSSDEIPSDNSDGKEEGANNEAELEEEPPSTSKPELVDNDDEIPTTPLSPEDICHIGTITIED